MLKSMTAYGRSQVKAPFGQVTVEVKSINRKGLEVVFSLPKEFYRFEPKFKEWIGSQIARGRLYLL